MCWLSLTPPIAELDPGDAGGFTGLKMVVGRECSELAFAEFLEFFRVLTPPGPPQG